MYRDYIVTSIVIIEDTFVTTIKKLSTKFIKSPHEMGHKFLKTQPIFNTFNHNTSLDSLNKQCVAIPKGLPETTGLKKVASLPPRHLSQNSCTFVGKETNVTSVSDYYLKHFPFRTSLFLLLICNPSSNPGSFKSPAIFIRPKACV